MVSDDGNGDDDDDDDGDDYDDDDDGTNCSTAWRANGQHATRPAAPHARSI